MCSAVIIYYFGKIFFPIKRKQGVNNCFKSLISSVFTTVKIISKRERERGGREGERVRERERERERECFGTISMQIAEYHGNKKFT